MDIVRVIQSLISKQKKPRNFLRGLSCINFCLAEMIIGCYPKVTLLKEETSTSP